jgi:hypothetical protein
MIKEASRVIKPKFKFNTFDELISDKELLGAFQLDILRTQINEENKYLNFISDRTTLDNFVYYEYNTADCVEIVNTYKTLAINHYINGYDYIIYVPIMFGIEDDGERNTDIKYQKDIDESVKKYLSLNKNVLTLKTLDIEDRIKEVMEFINKGRII